jgi:hypothetical protein
MRLLGGPIRKNGESNNIGRSVGRVALLRRRGQPCGIGVLAVKGSRSVWFKRLFSSSLARSPQWFCAI